FNLEAYETHPHLRVKEAPRATATCILKTLGGKSNSRVVRSTAGNMSNTWLMKKKLEQIKAEMQRLSERHALTCPERKAYHPFVWNSLSPYRDTTEIDYLFAMEYYSCMA
ncbi:hypothetical protein QTP70_026790, partial [Hemibagrus guttatus]